MSQFAHLIPNDVQAKLTGIANTINNADSNFGASVVSGWPGFPNEGIQRRQCLVTFSFKWDSKFKYRAGNPQVEQTRDGFTIQAHYKIYGKPEEQLEPDGIPTTLPFDGSNLPADKDNDVTKRLEMTSGKLATNLRGILNLSEADWKLRTATVVGLVDCLGQIMAKQSELQAGGIGGFLCDVDFQIRKWSSKDAKTGAERKGTDGTDFIRSLVTNPQTA